MCKHLIYVAMTSDKMADGGMVYMKKKILECSKHGLVLHRCKRKCWHSSGKSDKFASDYTEKCYICMAEGIHKKPVNVIKKKKTHISFR